ncbi:hypothetical protein, partial [Pontiella sp.]|uniref:hypothetical protein n=1 Tax=Pontiella sp. TaxID=2837462 RepID=UPI00356633ED
PHRFGHGVEPFPALFIALDDGPRNGTQPNGKRQPRRQVDPAARAPFVFRELVGYRLEKFILVREKAGSEDRHTAEKIQLRRRAGRCQYFRMPNHLFKVAFRFPFPPPLEFLIGKRISLFFPGFFVFFRFFSVEKLGHSFFEGVFLGLFPNC